MNSIFIDMGSYMSHERAEKLFSVDHIRALIQPYKSVYVWQVLTYIDQLISNDVITPPTIHTCLTSYGFVQEALFNQQAVDVIVKGFTYEVRKDKG